MAIDQTNTNIVYIAGDRIGTDPFTVTAFRVDATSFTPLTGANAGNTTAHADARVLVVEPNGDLLMGGDGGVYLRTSPHSGAWQGLSSSTLQVREPYAVAYGANAHLLVIAAQDTGVAIQSKANSPIFNAIQAGDGANAVVSDKTPGMSIYCTSSQNLGSLSRLIIGSNGQQISPGIQTYLPMAF